MVNAWALESECGRFRVEERGGRWATYRRGTLLGIVADIATAQRLAELA